MRNIQLYHDAPTLNDAFSISLDEQDMMNASLDKIINRMLTIHEYKYSHSIQDIITCVRLYTGKDPESPITQDEMLITIIAWRLGKVVEQAERLEKLIPKLR